MVVQLGREICGGTHSCEVNLASVYARGERPLPSKLGVSDHEETRRLVTAANG